VWVFLFLYCVSLFCIRCQHFICQTQSHRSSWLSSCCIQYPFTRKE
jgi:hypothetical protein